MKRRLIAIALTSFLALPAVWADDEDSTSTTGDIKEKSGASTGILLSKLMDAKVVSSEDENLGQLEDVLINPQTGKIEYAVLGRGGFLGIGEKLVPVPWKAFNVQSEEQFTLNISKEKLRSAPTTDKTFSNLINPGYTVTIYRFFAVPVEAGGAESPGGDTTTTDSDPSSSTTDTSTDDDDDSSSGTSPQSNDR